MNEVKRAFSLLRTKRVADAYRAELLSLARWICELFRVDIVTSVDEGYSIKGTFPGKKHKVKTRMYGVKFCAKVMRWERENGISKNKNT